MSSLWSICVQALEAELPEQDFNTWVRPLQVVEGNGVLKLLAPNRFAVEWVNGNLLQRVGEILRHEAARSGGAAPIVTVEVGSLPRAPAVTVSQATPPKSGTRPRVEGLVVGAPLNPDFGFASFVEGKGNQFARAACLQVAENPGKAYNPLFLYGGVGLGKTHLMHAVAHFMKERDSEVRVAYVHSERFVNDMVSALQHNTMSAFKTAYRSLDALLIDDIQFFAGKDRSQEEFFHTFNVLLEGQRQVILTCDRLPNAVDGMEARLKSRFGSGMTVAIESPDTETCAAILMSKARSMKAALPDEVAFFIAKHLRSNIRELEGALKRVIANSRFTGQPITKEFARDALRDLLQLQARLVTLENIRKTVAEYFKVRVADLQGKSRSRSIVRPRQIAMALARELTQHSLPEIGDYFGGRDHTTVMHACSQVKALRAGDARVAEDFSNLLRTLEN